MSLSLRRATREDAAALLAIYAPFVADTVVSFEYEVPSVEEFAGRITSISAFYPYLVCTDGDRPVGYAYANRQPRRAAYQWNAELSVYVSPAYQRRGVGRAFYLCLAELLRRQNICTLYAVIVHPNEKSERFHRQFGFTLAGIERNAGYKAGVWRDVATYTLPLCGYAEQPRPILPVGALGDAAFEGILSEGARAFTRE